MNSLHSTFARITVAIVAAFLAVVVIGSTSTQEARAGGASSSVSASKDGAPKHPKTKRGKRRHAKSSVVGGYVPMAGVWPWTTAILDKSCAVYCNPATATDASHQFCGGTLINPRVVLTAAHCIWYDANGDDVPDTQWQAHQLQVMLGRDDLTRPGGERINVSRVLTHPSYDPQGHPYDVALLELASPSRATPAVIREQNLPVPVGTLASSMGWGATQVDANGKSYAPSDYLLAVDVPTVSDADCKAHYASFDPAVMVCAGVPGSGRDTCQGDSGGPLMVQNPGGAWRLIGVVSFGGVCGGSKPGVYAWIRSGNLRNWIDAAVSQLIGGGSGGGNGGGGGHISQAARDTSAPVVQTLSLSGRFSAARRGASMATRIGTTIRYRISEPAYVRFMVRRAGRGRGARQVKGTMVHLARKGSNRFGFTGRMGGRKLRPGTYNLIAQATDAAGNRSIKERIRFRIVR